MIAVSVISQGTVVGWVAGAAMGVSVVSSVASEGAVLGVTGWVAGVLFRKAAANRWPISIWLAALKWVPRSRVTSPADDAK